MKKYLLSVPVIFILSLLFVSCEREISFENGGFTTPVGPGGSATGTAQYSYDGGTGTCNGAVVNGTYTAGTALTATNAVIVTVDVDSIGTYSISTNTVNGISFRATGTFTATGSQTITFAGTGTPAAAGSFNFTPGTTGCSFSITVTGGSTVTANCKDCQYFPSCVNSTYTFSDTTNGVAGEFTSTYNSSVDTTIAGVVFQKIGYTTTPSSLASNNTLYYNCSSGAVTLKAYNSVTLINGTTIVEATTHPIKENEAVSAAWADITPTPGFPDILGEQRFSVVEKGITHVAGGTTFNDVIHIQLSTGNSILGIFTESAITDYYYAKGVGLVESISFNVMLNQVFKHQVIKTYFIP